MALREALFALGQDGWELVSSVRVDSAASSSVALTHLFKRQQRP